MTSNDETDDIRVAIGAGTALDNYLILKVKEERFVDQPERLIMVKRELEEYESIVHNLRARFGELAELMKRLLEIHERLWGIEDEKRVIEGGEDEEAMIKRLRTSQNSGALDQYLRLARRVSKYNDERAAIKKKINEITGSRIVEIKSYGKNSDR